MRERLGHPLSHQPFCHLIMTREDTAKWMANHLRPEPDESGVGGRARPM